MSTSGVLSSFLSIAAAVAAGRVALACLPAGEPGGHRRRELWITAAASYLLGSIAIEAEMRVLVAFGVEPSAWAMTAPWIVLAIARCSTLPGMIVPRRGVLLEPPSKLVSAVSSTSALAVCLAAWKGGAVFGSSNAEVTSGPSGAVIAAASMVALLAVLGHGLERARRPPLERAAWIALLAAALACAALVAPYESPSSRSVLCFGSGAAFVIPWLRRADRRAAALSAVAFGGAALFSAFGALLGAAGAAWMCASTAASARKRVALATASAIAVCGAIWAAAALRSGSASGELSRALAIGIERRDLASACIAAVACTSALRRSAARSNASRAAILAQRSGDRA
jgi:hypothetical protein